MNWALPLLLPVIAEGLVAYYNELLQVCFATGRSSASGILLPRPYRRRGRRTDYGPTGGDGSSTSTDDAQRTSRSPLQNMRNSLADRSCRRLQLAPRRMVGLAQPRLAHS